MIAKVRGVEVPAGHVRMTLRKGDTGLAVRTLQNLLKANGFTAVGPTDGDFGNATHAAVLTFQQSHNLQVDGIVGPNTWNALTSIPGMSYETVALPAGTPRAQDLLGVALDEIGNREMPDGSNGGGRIDMYTGNWRVPWCFPGDVEILTEDGFVPFSEYAGQRVAQVEQSTLRMELVHPLGVIEKDYEGPLVEIDRRSLKIAMDPEHRMFGTWKRPARKAFAKDWPERELFPIKDLASGAASTLSIPTVSGGEQGNPAVTDEALFLLGAFIADGFFHQHERGSRKLEFQVSRPWKIELLQGLAPKTVYTAPRAYGRSTVPLTTIQFEVPPQFEDAFIEYKVLRPSFIWSLSARQAGVLLDAVQNFDGSDLHTDHHILRQADPAKIRALMHVATVAGYRAQDQEPKVGGEWKSLMHTMTYTRSGRPLRITSDQVTTTDSVKTTLYCVEVPSGVIVVKPRHGSVIAVGNCSLFVSWALRQCAWNPWPKPLAAVVKVKAWALEHKLYEVGADYEPQPGDLFVMLKEGQAGVDPSHGHVGIVLRYDAKKRVITTIEGNCANAVRSMHRPTSTIDGFVRLG